MSFSLSLSVCVSCVRYQCGDPAADHVCLPVGGSHVAVLVLGDDHEVRGQGGHGGEFSAHPVFPFSFFPFLLLAPVFLCCRWWRRCRGSSMRSQSCWRRTARCGRTTSDACSSPPTRPSSRPLIGSRIFSPIPLIELILLNVICLHNLSTVVLQLMNFYERDFHNVMLFALLNYDKNKNIDHTLQEISLFLIGNFLIFYKLNFF